MNKITVFDPAAAADSSPPAGVSSWSILIADDNARLLELLARNLKALRHRVVGIAHDGKEAVALAQKLRPDLIILDIDMPLMDGIDAARAILRQQSVPIVINTGASDDHTLRRLRSVKIGAYIVKPFSPAQLKVALHTAMLAHHAESHVADPPARELHAATHTKLR